MRGRLIEFVSGGSGLEPIASAVARPARSLAANSFSQTGGMNSPPAVAVCEIARFWTSATSKLLAIRRSRASVSPFFMAARSAKYVPRSGR